jgi:hypothetical protein
MIIDLADSIMVTEYDHHLDVTFNGGAVVRLCRCTAEKFPESMVIELSGSPDQMRLGVPRELHEFFKTMGDEGGGVYLLHGDDYDAFLAHIKAGGQQVFEACDAATPMPAA